LIKTVVPDNPKNNIRFKICRLFWSYHKEGLGQQLRDLEISNNVLKNKAKFSPMLDSKNVSNIFLQRKVAFTIWNSTTYLKAWIGNFETCLLLLPHLLQLNTLTDTSPIIDLFICLEACCHVTSKNINCKCHLSTVVTSKLTNDSETDYSII